MTYTAEQIKELIASIGVGRTLPPMQTKIALEQLLKMLESAK
jgi:hypothetical protein